MATNEQKATKIRAALEQLDPANDAHWTDDGLPREGVVRTFASDQNLSRKEISDARPGFQRHPTKPDATAATAAAPEHDPISGEPTTAATDATPAVIDGVDLGPDPTQNTGELLTEDEVRRVLEARVKACVEAVADAQQDVRDANNRVITAQNDLQKARENLTREFPPLTAAENIKQYIASEMSLRAQAHGYGAPGIAPGSQIDAAMQRSNSRGWRRPSRNGPVQTGAARPAA